VGLSKQNDYLTLPLILSSGSDSLLFPRATTAQDPPPHLSRGGAARARDGGGGHRCAAREGGHRRVKRAPAREADTGGQRGRWRRRVRLPDPGRRPRYLPRRTSAARLGASHRRAPAQRRQARLRHACRGMSSRSSSS
jgi:hypothetical protein